jgi:hypothetical protein
MIPLARHVLDRRSAIAFACAVSLAMGLVTAGAAPAHAQAMPPSCTGPNLYGQGASGTGNYGTADQIWTWSSWSVSDPAENFSDESVWSLDANNPNQNALEVGFFSGYGKDNIGGDPNWSNGMVPYYTTGDGTNEYDEWGEYLPSDEYIYMIAQANNNGSLAYVAGALDANLSYVVSQPRWNFTQGEVSNTGTWMGGGSGDSSTVYWLDSSDNMHPWQYIATCENSPYWADSSNGTDYFENGGY